MDEKHVEGDLVNVLFSEEQIQARLAELAREIERDYEGKEILLVGVLKGAVMVMADLARHFGRHVEMDWMAISSYGAGTKSSGVVRILKDLDTDINGRHVLVVEDIIDTGLTLSWLVSNRDLILVQDVVMILVVAVLVVNFLVDLLYLLIDPRLRAGAR
jgi:hypoxanthine phosphoribosyltransferase